MRWVFRKFTERKRVPNEGGGGLQHCSEGGGGGDCNIAVRGGGGAGRSSVTPTKERVGQKSKSSDAKGGSPIYYVGDGGVALNISGP